MDFQNSKDRGKPKTTWASMIKKDLELMNVSFVEAINTFFPVISIFGIFGCGAKTSEESQAPAFDASENESETSMKTT